jgi:hypothetical protein
VKRRLLFFLLFASLGVGGLLRLGGGLTTSRPETSTPDLVVLPPPSKDAPPELALNADGSLPVRTTGGRDVLVHSATETLVFDDPGSGARREIRGWFTWRFRCARFSPLPATGGSAQGVRCEDVVLELFRAPRTLAEAEARMAGQLEAVLHQRIRADEAVAIGTLAGQLRRTEGIVEDEVAARNVIHLSGRVELEDLEQWVQVHGDDLTVHPNQGRIEGKGPFRVEHEALTMTGEGLEMDQVERGWSRVRVLRRPRLTVHGDLKDAQGRPVFSFGDGEMRPTEIVSDDEAILIRETARRETRLRLQFPRGVRAEQSGGRFLEAGRLELLAIREGPPRARSEDHGGGWVLRELHGDKGVSIDYRDATADGRTYLASIQAADLLHLVPPSGAARTELTGQPRIVVRGSLPLGSLAREGDRLLASATDKAWIEPLEASQADPVHEGDALRRIVLQGHARVERHNPTAGVREDTLQAERIEFTLRERPASPGIASRTTVTTIVADGDVRLGSEALEGSTPRFVAEALDTARPRLSASGNGTVVTLPLLREDQGLLGAEPRRSTAPAPGQPDGESPPRWTVRRLVAAGEVGIQTQVGGASVGLPTWVDAHEAIYEEPALTARLNGRPGAPARIRSRAGPDHVHEIEAMAFVLDRAAGRIAAERGVRAVVWVTEEDGGTAMGGLGTARDVRPVRSLTLRTDARIDLALARDPDVWRLDVEQEQHLRIDGPVTAELRSAAMVVDQLRARTLDITLARATPAAAEPRVAAPAAPFARLLDPAARPAAPASAPPRTTAPVRRTRVDVVAGDVQVQFTDGEVEWLDASGGVDLTSTMGRVAGERLRYAAAGQRVDIASGPQRPAAAWLGDSEARTEIEAARLGLVWVDGEARRADATAPEGATARIRLYRRDRKRPERLERYVIQYRGTIELEPTWLRAHDVVVQRVTTNTTTGVADPPALLIADHLEVTGRQLLSRAPVEVDRMVATGARTFFQAGHERNPVRVWGTRFDFDVPAAQATLTGAPPRGVTIQRDDMESDHERVVIDLKDGLPLFLDGSSIIWRPSTR